MKPKIYIAGRMTGMPGNNWDTFFLKEEMLKNSGWDVVNPARMDKESGVDPSSMNEYSYESCAGRDIAMLRTCNAIYMMDGWQFSKGACWERALAKYWSIKRFYETPRADHEFL